MGGFIFGSGRAQYLPVAKTVLRGAPLHGAHFSLGGIKLWMLGGDILSAYPKAKFFPVGRYLSSAEAKDLIFRSEKKPPPKDKWDLKGKAPCRTVFATGKYWARHSQK